MRFGPDSKNADIVYAEKNAGWDCANNEGGGGGRGAPHPPSPRDVHRIRVKYDLTGACWLGEYTKAYRRAPWEGGGGGGALGAHTSDARSRAGWWRKGSGVESSL